MKYYIFSFRCLVLITRYKTDNRFVQLMESEADVETPQTNLLTDALPQTDGDNVVAPNRSEPMFIQFIE